MDEKMRISGENEYDPVIFGLSEDQIEVQKAARRGISGRQSGWIMLGENGWLMLGGRRVPSDWDLLAEYLTNDVLFRVIDIIATRVCQVRWKLFARKGSEGASGYSEKPLRGHAGQRTAEKFFGGAGRTLDDHEPRRRMVSKALGREHESAQEVAKDDDVVEITDHPLLDMIYRANFGLTATQLRYMSSVYFDLFGGAYYWIQNGRLGRPSGLKIIPSYRLAAYRKNESDVVAYQYYPVVAVPDQVDILDARDVMPIRRPSPNDPYAGRNAPARSAWDAVCLCRQYTAWQSTLFSNRERPDAIWTPDKDAPFGADAARRMAAEWRSYLHGSRNGRVLVAEQAGALQVPRYAQDIGELKVSGDAVGRVCLAFGLPESYLSAGAKYDNAAEGGAAFAKGCVLPRVMIAEEAWNTYLVPRFGEGLFLAAENPVPRDEAVETQRAQIAIAAGVLTVNEQRAALGFDVLEEEWASKLPAQPAAAATQATTAGVTEPEPSNPPPADPKPQVESAHAPPLAKELCEAPARIEEAQAKEADFLLEVNKMVASGTLERATAIELVRRRTGDDETVCKSLVGHIHPATKTPEGAPAVKNADKILSGVVPEVADLKPRLEKYFATQAKAWTRGDVLGGALDGSALGPGSLGQDNRTLAALLLLGWQGAGKSVLTDAGKRFGLSPSQATAAEKKFAADAATASAKYAAEINESSRQRVVSELKALQEARAAGAGPGDVGRAAAEKAIQALFDAWAKTRPGTIADDQVYRAKVSAQIGAAEQRGDVTTVYWVTAGDEKVCPICQSLDGTSAPLGGAFHMVAGDIEGPPAHVNCRCWLIYSTTDGKLIFGEGDPDTGPGVGPEPQP